MRNQLSRALVAEFVGTFALVFVGAGAAATGIGGVVGVAFAHGLILASFAYAYGHVSGTHVNPAVTIAVWAAGKTDLKTAVSYVVFQLLGGIAGALALRYVLGGTETGLGATVLGQGVVMGDTIVDITPSAGLLIEIVMTFFLVNVILNAAISGRVGESSGLAIGLTLAACILFAWPLTGASLNPARTLGPAVAVGNFADLWLYVVGPVVGGLVATGLYRGALED